MDRNTDAATGRTSSRSSPRGHGWDQLMQPWVTGLWLGRDTLSDEPLVGSSWTHEKSGSPSFPRTSTMGARSVDSDALHTVVITSESSGRPRLQRPAYEEPFEA